MALTRKSGTTKATVATANPVPDQLYVPLPEVVVKRFPAMEQWQSDNQDRMRQMIEAMDRRSEELEARIAALEGS